MLREVERLDALKPELQVTANTTGVLSQLDALSGVVNGLDAARVVVNVASNTDAAMRDLIDMRTALQGLRDTPVVVKAKADVEQAITELGRVRSEIRDLDGETAHVAASSSGLGGILGGLGKQALGVASGIGIANVATGLLGGAFGFLKDAAIGTNATLETTTLQFETLMGSSDKAAQHVAALFDFAKKTPFETGPVIQASRSLEVFGGAALDTLDNLRLFGDAAAATSAPLEEVTFWVGRAYAAIQAGQPFGEATQRLQELAILTPQVVQHMRDLQASGASSDEVWAVLSASFDHFSGSMEKQAGTWAGLTSSVSDFLKLTAAQVLAPFFDDAKGAMQRFLDTAGTADFQAKVDGWTTTVEHLSAALVNLPKRTDVQVTYHLVKDSVTNVSAANPADKPADFTDLSTYPAAVDKVLNQATIGINLFSKVAQAELINAITPGADGDKAQAAWGDFFGFMKDGLTQEQRDARDTGSAFTEAQKKFVKFKDDQIAGLAEIDKVTATAVVSGQDYIENLHNQGDGQQRASETAAEFNQRMHDQGEAAKVLGGATFSLIGTVYAERDAMQAAADAAFNMQKGAQAAWLETSNLAAGLGTAKGAVSEWEGHLSDAQAALKILDEESARNGGLSQDQQAQYDELTHAVGRYQGGIEDSQGAVVDATVKQATFIDTQDALNKKLADHTITQEEYNAAMVSAVTAMDPVAGAQLGMADSMAKVGEATRGVVDDLVKLLDAMGLIPHSVAVDILGDSSNAQQAADDAQKKADDFSSNSPYKAGFEADTDPATTNINSVEELSNHYSKLSPSTSFDADIHPASGHLTDLGVELQTYEQSNPNTQVSADTGPAVVSQTALTGMMQDFIASNPGTVVTADTTDAVAKATDITDRMITYEALNPSTTASADTTTAQSNIDNLALSAGNLDGYNIELTADVNIAPAMANLGILGASIPHSPAEIGPLSHVPDWNYIVAGLPATLDTGVGYMADGGAQMMTTLQGAIAGGAAGVTNTAGLIGAQAGVTYGAGFLSGAAGALNVAPTIGDLIATAVGDAGVTAAASGGLAGKDVVDALVKGAEAGLPEWQNVFETMHGDALTALDQMQTDLLGKIRLAEIAGDDTSELVKKLAAVRQIIIDWAQATGQDFQSTVAAMVTPDTTAQDAITQGWLDLLGNLDSIVSGDFQNKLKDKLATMTNELSVAVATGAPQSVIDALTSQQAAIEAQLTEASLAYQAAIDAGMTDPAAWQKTQDELKAQADLAKAAVESQIAGIEAQASGQALTNAAADVQKYTADLAYAQATGASQIVIATLKADLGAAQASMNALSGALSNQIALGIASPEAIAAYNAAMGIVTQVPIDQLKALIPQMADGGLSLIDSLVSGVASGQASVDDVLSLFGDKFANFTDLATQAGVDPLVAASDDFHKYIAQILTDGNYLNDWLTHLPEDAQKAAKAFGKSIAGMAGTGVDDIAALQDALVSLEDELQQQLAQALVDGTDPTAIEANIAVIEQLLAELQTQADATAASVANVQPPALGIGGAAGNYDPAPGGPSTSQNQYGVSKSGPGGGSGGGGGAGSGTGGIGAGGGGPLPKVVRDLITQYGSALASGSMSVAALTAQQDQLQAAYVDMQDGVANSADTLTLFDQNLDGVISSGELAGLTNNLTALNSVLQGVTSGAGDAGSALSQLLPLITQATPGFADYTQAQIDAMNQLNALGGPMSIGEFGPSTTMTDAAAQLQSLSGWVNTTEEALHGLTAGATNLSQAQQKLVDTNRDGAVSAEELAGAHATLERAEAKLNGMMLAASVGVSSSTGSIQDLMAAAGPLAAALADMQDGLVSNAATFALLDTNLNNHIDDSELAVAQTRWATLADILQAAGVDVSQWAAAVNGATPQNEITRAQALDSALDDLKDGLIDSAQTYATLDTNLNGLIDPNEVSAGQHEFTALLAALQAADFNVGQFADAVQTGAHDGIVDGLAAATDPFAAWGDTFVAGLTDQLPHFAQPGAGGDPSGLLSNHVRGVTFVSSPDSAGGALAGGPTAAPIINLYLRPDQRTPLATWVYGEVENLTLQHLPLSASGGPS